MRVRELLGLIDEQLRYLVLALSFSVSSSSSSPPEPHARNAGGGDEAGDVLHTPPKVFASPCECSAIQKSVGVISESNQHVSLVNVLSQQRP
jgi:hypothetical protein